MSQQNEPNSGRSLVPQDPKDLAPSDRMPPEVLKDMVEFLTMESQVRQQELELRKEELSIRKEQVQNAHEFSMESLRLQAKDLQDERSHRSKFFNQRNGFGLVFLLILIGFTVYLLQGGHEELAKEILKALGFFAAGGIGGYGYASQKKKDKEKVDVPQAEDDD